MAEIFSIKFQETINESRIYAEFYRYEYIEIQRILSENKPTELINIASITDGEHGSPEIVEDGFICLSGNNIKKGSILIGDTVKKVSKQQFEKNQRAILNKNNILLSIVGTVGNAAIVLDPIQGITDRNIATIVLHNNTEFDPYFVAMFLNSKYGKKQTERFSTGNIQQLLNLTQVGKVLIPKLNHSFQQNIAKRFLDSIDKKHKAIKIYTECEENIFNEINMTKFKLSEEKIFQSTFSEISKNHRFDADYYQPKYAQIIKKIEDYKSGYNNIEYFFNINKTKIDTNKNQYNYVEIGDIDITNSQIYFNIVNKEDLPDNAKIKLCNGDMIISKVRPNRGAVAIINSNENNMVGDGAFSVLQEKGDFSKEVLLILLRSSIYKNLLLKYNVGTSYPVIKDEDILKLIIPKIDKKIQENITEKIKLSNKLRDEAINIYDDAIKQIETHIEKNINIKGIK